MKLHPDFPVVSGDYQLNKNWSISLPFEMNRRIEQQDLVLWRPGFTIWMSTWGNDHNESIEERLRWIEEDSSEEAFDLSIERERSPSILSYKLNESREEGMVHALYGFALKDHGHIQIAIYIDQQTDFATAEQIVGSIR